MTDWNGFKGAAKRLDDIDLPRESATIGVGEDILHGLIDCESRGKGFDAQGRPVILFEPHVFYRCLPKGAKRDAAVKAGIAYAKWKAGAYPKDSYPRLLKAIAIDEAAALKACSWGMFQVLGENHKMVGFPTPQAMVRAMMADEENHLRVAVRFIKAAGIDDDLRRVEAILKKRQVTAEECAPPVRVYNGPGYAKNGYHSKLAASLNRWRKIPDTPYVRALDLGPLPSGAVDIAFSVDPEAAHPVAKTGHVAALEAPAPVPNPGILSSLWSTIRGKPVLPPTTAPAAAATKGDPLIFRVQKALQDRGFTEVGKLDGDMPAGGSTEGAVANARAAAGLSRDGGLDDEFLAALPKLPPKAIAPERAAATIGTLKDEGQPTVASLGSINVAQRWLLGLAGGGVLDATGALEGLRQSADQAKATMATAGEVASTVLGVVQWCVGHWWIFAAGIAFVVIWKAVKGALGMIVLYRQGFLTKPGA